MVLPADFISYTKRLMGEELFNIFEKAIKEEATSSIRVNPLKCDTSRINIPLEGGCIPWCKNSIHGVYLKHRPNFTFDPLLHAGLYYVQEASSMFITKVLSQWVNTPVKMLDLCAAPGGKSTAAKSVLPAGSLLFSNEPMRNRANILSENIAKFGDKDIIVTNNFPSEYKKSGLMFDVILTDVPCSGEGMFRKDEVAIKEWSKQNVENCWQKQREIVSDIWSCLKPGGILIYSTCTFNTKENEENVKWISEELGASFLSVDINDDWCITGSLLNGFTEPVYRFIPGKTKGEGLFMAVLRKNADSIDNDRNSKIKKDKRYKIPKGNNEIMRYANFLLNRDDFDITSNRDEIIAIPKKWKKDFDLAEKSLKVISAGITLGTVKGKDMVPSQQLALSTELNRAIFPVAELIYDDAIAFLRKEAVPLPFDTPKGYVLITYCSVPLGFEKNIGNRANNLYPMEWKIKSSHTPNEDREVLMFDN